jgi:hypothetical protein
VLVAVTFDKLSKIHESLRHKNSLTRYK